MEDITFGELIEKRLNESNISMRELARRAEVNVAYISKLIKNKSKNPSYVIATQIATALNISQEELNRIFKVESENIEDVVKNTEKSLTYEEKNKIKEIVDTIVDDMDDLSTIANVVVKIGELRKLKKSPTFNKKYYIINYFSRDEMKILETSFTDDKFLRLYCSVLNCNVDDCLVIEGDIKSIPQFYKEASYTTLLDIIEPATSLDENDELYDDYTNLKSYIQERLKGI